MYFVKVSQLQALLVELLMTFSVRHKACYRIRLVSFNFKSLFKQAGIPHGNFVIALEPECASIYCKSLSEEKLGSSSFKKVGSNYLVLDNGGM